MLSCEGWRPGRSSWRPREIGILFIALFDKNYEFFSTVKMSQFFVIKNPLSGSYRIRTKTKEHPQFA
jgi:hypothetical protein